MDTLRNSRNKVCNKQRVLIKIKISERVTKLSNTGAEPGGVAVLKHEGAFVFYLVTKQRYSHKPTYESLESSLRSLRERCVASDVKELCMPTIGCGLDGLDWRDVELMIKRVFNDVSISITIYHL